VIQFFSALRVSSSNCSSCLIRSGNGHEPPLRNLGNEPAHATRDTDIELDTIVDLEVSGMQGPLDITALGKRAFPLASRTKP
jgi:hypothetical protein